MLSLSSYDLCYHHYHGHKSLDAYFKLLKTNINVVMVSIMLENIVTASHPHLIVIS